MEQDLIDALDRLGAPDVLVIGDLMLDRYTFGITTKISQEAPVLVLTVERVEDRLGGAANVCNLLAALDANVHAVGVVGDDLEGRVVASLLQDSGANVSAALVDRSRPTTVKNRLMGEAKNRHASQMLRVDRESTCPLDSDVERRIIGEVARLLPRQQAILISDYNKGLCTPKLTRSVIEMARDEGLPVLIDPHFGADYEQYRGATVIKPNRFELESLLAKPIESPRDAIDAGYQLCHQFDLDAVAVTLDSEGIALSVRDGAHGVFPAMPSQVRDITGAGDIVLAVLGLCLADQDAISLNSAVRLANVAAGLEVERLGAARIRQHEIRAAVNRQLAAKDTKLLQVVLIHQVRRACFTEPNGLPRAGKFEQSSVEP